MFSFYFYKVRNSYMLFEIALLLVFLQRKKKKTNFFLTKKKGPEKVYLGGEGIVNF